MAPSAVPGLSTVASSQAIGDHQPLFSVEKNENPQNILVAYTKLDSNCHFVFEKPAVARAANDNDVGETKSSALTTPVLDYYWLMDHRTYKPVHPLIKGGIRDRLQLISHDADSFQVRVRDLKELDQDLGDAVLRVQASASKSGCGLKVTIKLGPSDHGQVLRLTSLYTEGATTVLPPFRKVVAVTLKGFDVATGAAVSRRYTAR